MLPLSLPKWLSISLSSKQNELFTLGSEPALLLVARGESDTLRVLLLVEPVLTLYIDEAGMFVINGLRLPGTLRLMSCKEMNRMS